MTCTRAYVCDMNNLSRPDGSATFCHGDTSVQTAVYGPTEVRIQKEIVDKAHIEVLYKPKIGLPGTTERLLEHIVKNTCEAAILTSLHPRTSISIIIQELENRGGVLSCAINSTCLALIDSGIEMNYLFGATSCALNADGSIIINPTLKQERDSIAVATLTFDSQTKQIIGINTQGSFSEAQFETCIESCRNASEDVFTFYRQSVEKMLSKDK